MTQNWSDFSKISLKVFQERVGHWDTSGMLLPFQEYWGVGVGVNQAYSRLSTTLGHISDCKFHSVVYAGVCEVI